MLFSQALTVDTVCVQTGNVISANIYRADDAPLYHRGNTVLMIINFLVIGVFIFTKIYYVSRNRWKARKWDGMTEEVYPSLILRLFVKIANRVTP
jgi:uncharacterized protein (DUF983 family)